MGLPANNLNLNPPYLYGVTMATPNILCIEVRDPAIIRSPLTTVTPEAPIGTHDLVNIGWQVHPEVGEYGRVLGYARDTFWTTDKRPLKYPNRAVAYSASAWNTANPSGVCGRTVTAVYYAVDAYDYGFDQGFYGQDSCNPVSMRHYIYLHLTSAPNEGSYTINYPANFIKAYNDVLSNMAAPISFTYDKNKTESLSIVPPNHVGFRPGDGDKLGYVLFHNPGPNAPDEGVTDFLGDYFIDEVEVIDDTGTVLATVPLTLRHAWDDEDEGNGLGPDLFNGYGPAGKVRIASNTRSKWHKVASFTKATEGVFTFVGSPPPLNSVVKFFATQDLGIDLTSFGSQGKVESIVGSTCKLRRVDNNAMLNTTGWPDIAADTGSTSNIAKGWYWIETLDTNAVGTNVYQFDLTGIDWSPGRYRIKAGFAVSKPFVVDDAAWLKAARNGAHGEYHSRNGIPIDGRFGTTMPARMTNGVGGIQIKKSRLPKIWTAYSGYLHPAVTGVVGPWDYGNGLLTPQIGIERAHQDFETELDDDSCHEWLDAGDFDEALDGHWFACWDALDVYECLPSPARDLDLGLPKASEVCPYPGDIYAGTDGMGDLFQSGLWFAHAYLTRQNDGSDARFPDGSVQSGLTYNDPFYAQINPNTGTHYYWPGPGPDYGLADQGGMWAGWLGSAKVGNNPMGVASYGPDPESTLIACAIFAKVSCIFADQGHTAAAAVYADAAQRAWDWGYELLAGPEASFDAYFQPLATIAGWDSTVYGGVKAYMRNISGNKTIPFAACLMYRLTGSNTYRDICEPHLFNTDWPILGGKMASEYMRISGANAGNKTALIAEFEEAITSPVGEGYLPQYEAANSIRKLRRFNGGHPWGGDGFMNIYALDLVRCWKWGTTTSLKELCVKIMQMGASFRLGANVHNTSYVSGIGHRNLGGTLNLDHRHGGIITLPSGQVVYGTSGVADYAASSLAGNYGFFQFTQWSLGGIASNPRSDFPLDAQWSREWEPAAGCWPAQKFLPESPLMVGLNEFTVVQTVMPHYIMCYFLHCYDNNSVVKEFHHLRAQLAA